MVDVTSGKQKVTSNSTFSAPGIHQSQNKEGCALISVQIFFFLEKKKKHKKKSVKKKAEG